MSDRLNPIDRYLALPLAGDLLGEEFEPHSDPKGRKHTLGRLALAVREKGTSLQSYFGRPMPDGVVAWQYMPTWAPGVDATLTCRVQPGRGYIEEFAGLTLEYSKEDDLVEPGRPRRRPATTYLDVQTRMVGANTLGYEMTEWHQGVRPGAFQRREATSGPSIIEARLLVGRAAQRFFDALPEAA
ncbi:MAG TPA: hypothetical protein VGS28_04960 [Candidatus Saccharimonadales bacterium]|nr:hypothetical protein [Candidatus Saccharimonadales bacterium]